MHAPIALDGAVVVVTGAARGIGRATAELFLAHGARVALCDLDTETVADTATELGERAYPFSADVARRESFGHAIESIRDTLGAVDVLVNNAGIMPAGRFVDEPDPITDAIIDVNLRGPLTGTRLVLPEMFARRRGHIVNVASLLGKLQLPGLATYVASKHAVVGLGKALQPELANTGVTLTTVLPAIVNTELASGIPLPGFAARLLRVEPEDVARAVVGSLEHRRHEVAVPNWLGVYPALQPFVPPIVESIVRKLVGDDRALHGVDAAGRAAYDARVDRQTNTEAT